MSRLAASLLALGLCVAPGAVLAQSYGGDPRGMDRGGVFYDEAQVIRVDPVFDDADDRYARDAYGRDGYARDPYARDGYGRDAYPRDPYARDAYPDRRGGYVTGTTPSQRCYTRDEGYVDGYADRGYGYPGDAYGGGGAPSTGSETGRTVATVVGGVVGAVLGSKVGGGSGRYATSAIGTMVGGMAGRGIYDASQRQRRAQVTVCDPEPYAGGYDGGYRGVQASGVRWYDVTYEYGGRRHVTRTDYHPGDTIRVRVDVSAE